MRAFDEDPARVGGASVGTRHTLFAVQRRGDSGSPQVVGSTRPSRSRSGVGSLSEVDACGHALDNLAREESIHQVRRAADASERVDRLAEGVHDRHTVSSSLERSGEVRDADRGNTLTRADRGQRQDLAWTNDRHECHGPSVYDQLTREMLRPNGAIRCACASSDRRRTRTCAAIRAASSDRKQRRSERRAQMPENPLLPVEGPRQRPVDHPRRQNCLSQRLGFHPV
jgi:hypothetical protein